MSGYIDLQVNGYAGVDFNADEVTDQQFSEACERLRNDGVAAILATIITASKDQMLARVSRIAEFCDAHPEDSRVIAGIHIEGPFISREPGYVGAHPPQAVTAADLDFTRRLLDAACGRVKLLTLAPEMDAGARVTGYLAKHGVIVAGGHSNASVQMLKQFIDAGLSMWTHLGNGCPGVLPRHDNIIQRVLSLAESLTISFIADGHHVPPLALGNYLKIVPTNRVVIVSDAMLAAGQGPGDYWFAEQTVHVDESGAAWSEDRTHLAGSAATLRQMESVLRHKLSANALQIGAWMRDNARALLALSPKIDPGQMGLTTRDPFTLDGSSACEG